MGIKGILRVWEKRRGEFVASNYHKCIDDSHIVLRFVEDAVYISRFFTQFLLNL